MNKTDAKKLDKYYTKSEVAAHCLEVLKDKLNLTGTERFLEPSAGSGAFSSLLENVDAYDLYPEADGIIQADFLKVELDYDDYITVGNPPFGSRCKLVIDFFNKAAKHSKAVAFIMPITICKWGYQKNLDKDFALIHSETLDENSFSLLDGDYKIRCVFQIWVDKKRYSVSDKRLTENPPTKHKDFQIWQSHASPGTRKNIFEDWEIAVYICGYQDYNRIFTRDDYEFVKDKALNTNTHFILIKPLTDGVLEIVKQMDLDKLSKTRPITPGFGNADFIQEYEKIKKSREFIKN